MKELDLQQLCQEISKEYFHKEFQHQITYNARLKSTGGRYILKTGNIEINPKVETILGKEVLIGVIKRLIDKFCWWIKFNTKLSL